MPRVLKHSSKNASSVLWRQETKWCWKCSISVMGLFTLMVSMVLSGCAATNARKLTTWKKKKTSSSPFIVPLMSVGSRDHIKWVTLDLKQVVKWVNFSFTVAKQKTTPKKVKHGKDSRRIALRKKANAGTGFKDQLWDVKDLDLTFDLWEANKDKTPKEKLSKLAISKQTGICYTTVCERLSGHRGGGKGGE